MPLTIDQRGWITGASDIKSMPRPNIEHGDMKIVNGIIVHQTGGNDAASSLNSYKNKKANGAHFLIDKDGTIYQVASLLKQTWHVGRLKGRCIESHKCTPAELKIYGNYRKSHLTNRMEMHKATPFRYPSNKDSIGIELVGQCVLDKKYIEKGMSKEDIGMLTDRHGVFETVTNAQNTALASLIRSLQESLHIPEKEVFSHPTVSMKNPTEASTAKWPGR